MKNKKLLLAIFALFLVMGMMFGLYTATRPETVAGEKSVTVTVVHADGQSKVFPYQTDEEYLGPLLLAEGLVSGDVGQYGLVIDTVDGEQASWEKDQSYRAILIGKEYATVGADGVVLTDGGDYSLVYTHG